METFSVKNLQVHLLQVPTEFKMSTHENYSNKAYAKLLHSVSMVWNAA